MQKDTQATMYFAFKKALAGPKFLIGVLADGGLKDVSRLDYNDRFKASEAGSPVRGDFYYPLKMLYAVDNTCWEAYGMKAPLDVAKVCPPSLSEPVRAKQDVDHQPASPLATTEVPAATQAPVTDTAYP